MGWDGECFERARPTTNTCALSQRKQIAQPGVRSAPCPSNKERETDNTHNTKPHCRGWWSLLSFERFGKASDSSKPNEETEIFGMSLRDVSSSRLWRVEQTSIQLPQIIILIYVLYITKIYCSRFMSISIYENHKHKDKCDSLLSSFEDCNVL